jgi:eukaryotic-like serine/threonine-protein kinase
MAEVGETTQRGDERFTLHRMLGAGADGVSYAGFDAITGKSVVVHRLKLEATRKGQLADALKLVRLAKGEGVLDVTLADFDAAEPVLAVERPEATFAAAKLERDSALKLIRGLALLLTRAHRFGLFHGALTPAAVFLRETGAPALDFLNPATGSLLESPFDAACTAPEAMKDSAADIFSLGVLLSLALTGEQPAPFDETATAESGRKKDDVATLVRAMTDHEPTWRPAASEVAVRLTRVLDGKPAEPEGPSSAEGELLQLGRFKLDGLLGQGAMGRVYKATDLRDGKKVAVKLIDAQTTGSATALRRFRKEARLLSEVKTPYIANLIDANRDQGIHFIAVELAEGRDLGAELKDKGALPERDAVKVAADMARALVEVHARGIVHRDLKPSNVVLTAEGRARLIDFGIARHIDENASLELTETGAAVGTPAYMSPEACRGELLDVKADIYSLGCTLYALSCGHPPFSGESAGAIFSRHMFEAPPALDAQKDGLSSRLSLLVGRCLDKDKARRPDAPELLEELEHLLGRDLGDIGAHPLPPKHNGITTYKFEWDLKASPLTLWDYVANTDRLNRAAGMAPVEESFRSALGELERFGKNKSAGLNVQWKEHPYEWVHGRRLGVLREMVEGPLYWYRSAVDLKTKEGGGTHLTHTVEIEPRGVFGRVAAAAEIGLRLRLALGRVYGRIDELITTARDEPTLIADAFEERFKLSAEQEQRLSAIEKTMVDKGADPIAASRLGDFLRHAAAPEVARIRPLALARRLQLEQGVLITTCLWAAKEGALVLAWDLICPSCRVSSQMTDTLRAVKEHGRCEVCNLEYALDLAQSVELVFSAHPQIRVADRKLYCLSSPGHTPHVLAQVRVAKGERFELDLALDEGPYTLTGRRLPFTTDFRVLKGAPAALWEVPLSKGPAPGLQRSLAPGMQQLVLENDTDKEQLVRVERKTGRNDALTAAKVASHPLFRKLFPLEVLSPGQLVNVSNVALLMVELVSDGVDKDADSGSFSKRYALFRRLEEKAGIEGGAVVKLAGDGVVAVFGDVASAVRAGLKLGDDPLPLRAAVHKGPAAAVTFDEHLDYFGRTVREAAALLARARPRELVLSEAASSDPAVLALEAVHGKGSITLSGGAPAQRIPLGQAAS